MHRCALVIGSPQSKPTSKVVALYDFHGEQRTHGGNAFKKLQFVAFLGVSELWSFIGEKLHVKLIYVRQVGAVGAGRLPNGLSNCRSVSSPDCWCEIYIRDAGIWNEIE